MSDREWDSEQQRWIYPLAQKLMVDAALLYCVGHEPTDPPHEVLVRWEDNGRPMQAGGRCPGGERAQVADREWDLIRDYLALFDRFGEVKREKDRLVDAAASREHALLRLQDRINEMEQGRIAGVSHAMLGRAFARDDRDLLLDLGRRLAAEVGQSAEAARIAGEPAYPGQDHWYRGRSDLANELLALFPDDLR